MPRQLAPERGHDPEHVEARTMAVIEDCERVDRLGVESGLIDPDDPLYRRERRLFGQMRRESRSRRAYWQRRRRFAGLLTSRFRSGVSPWHARASTARVRGRVKRRVRVLTTPQNLNHRL